MPNFAGLAPSCSAIPFFWFSFEDGFILAHISYITKLTPEITSATIAKRFCARVARVTPSPANGDPDLTWTCRLRQLYAFFNNIHKVDFISALPFIHSPSSFEIPITRTRRHEKRGSVSGSIGLGNVADLIYTVPLEIGRTTTALHLDTGSSDLWVATDTCKTESCLAGVATRFPAASLNDTGAKVTMHYGDSTTGTFASGSIGTDTVTVAGIAMTDQYFAAVDDTTNPTVRYGAAGLFGLGFPSGSSIQKAAVNHEFNNPTETDEFVLGTYLDGPLLPRISMTNELQAPMFTITLQRNTIDIGGSGLLTVGKLPDGIDNSSLTWVPVRLYNEQDGGMKPPRFAPGEIYPYRWEIDVDGVFLDGKKLPESTIPAKGVDGQRVSALIDTGNSLIRGPADVVKNVLSQVSPTFSANNPAASHAILPCATPRTLAFQIGGKMFPVDPRDFIRSNNPGDAVNCVADNLVATDPPSKSTLFRWSLGDPFMKSNLVAFHYGNLTHPSADPPRIGFLSMVPKNISEVYAAAVQDARNNGGNFECTCLFLIALTSM
ncbi:hypothetical protein EYR38_002901 [Pleurotus pulmonarius]|nr:hypothetical protein EYR38_002901 [Pleurotus pulmonarius]